MLFHDRFGSARSEIANGIDSGFLGQGVIRKALRTFRHHALGLANIRIAVTRRDRAGHREQQRLEPGRIADRVHGLGKGRKAVAAEIRVVAGRASVGDATLPAAPEAAEQPRAAPRCRGRSVRFRSTSGASGSGFSHFAHGLHHHRHDRSGAGGGFVHSARPESRAAARATGADASDRLACAFAARTRCCLRPLRVRPARPGGRIQRLNVR